MANRFFVQPPNILQALMTGQGAYESADKRAQEAELKAAMEAAAPDVARGDYQAAMAKLGGRGGLQGLMGFANLQTQAAAAKRAEAALAESTRHNRAVESRPQIVGNAETGFYAIPTAGASIAAGPAPMRPGAPPGSGMFPTREQGGNPPPDVPAGLQPIIPPAPVKAPFGWERMPDGSIRPETGGPADPEYQRKLLEAKKPTENLEPEQKLRKEFELNSKTHLDVRRGFERVLASKDNAAGDISLIFGYMKILDPGSVVREGEFATAQNAAGIPDIVRNMYNRALEGTRLNPNQRAQFKGQAEALYQKSSQEYSAREKQMRAIAERYGLDPDRVIPNLGAEPTTAKPDPLGIR